MPFDHRHFTEKARALVAESDRVPVQRAPWELKRGDRVLVIRAVGEQVLLDVEDVQPTEDGLTLTAAVVSAGDERMRA